MKKAGITLISLGLIVSIGLGAFILHKNSYSQDSSNQGVVKNETKKVDVNTTSMDSASKEQTTESKNSKSETDKNEARKEINVPIKINKIIVIDPGHANKSNLHEEPLAPNSSEMKIKDGGGAEGVVTKNPEYLINMQVSLKLKQILEQRGYIVKMTKTNNSETLGNVERAEIWNSDNADLAIRIHADSSDNSSARGASMLVPAPINENTKAIFSKSEEYGQVILNTLTKEVGMQNRGVVQRADMTGFNWSKVPVILVEMGFLSNPEEDKLLGTDEYQNKIALALADGICAAVK